MRLNVKQKILLGRIYSGNEKISYCVENLACELGCSEGCLWGNLRELKKLGLVENGVVSDLGRIVCEELGVLKGGGEDG